MFQETVHSVLLNGTLQKFGPFSRLSFASMEDVHGHWVRDRVRKDIKVEVLCFDKFCTENGKYRTVEIFMSG